MSDIYEEMHSYRIACCEANAKANALEAENATHKEEKALFFNEIDRLKAENANLKALIKAADCPCCDKSGAYYDGHGEVCQCEWCYEYSLVMKE